MPTYKIDLTKPAAKYLNKLDKITQKRITSALYKLAENPETNAMDIKPLIGSPCEFRLRVGDYRVFYTLENDVLTIIVIAIRPRGDAYK